MYIESDHLRYCEATGRVSLLLAGGDSVNLGPIDEAADELPSTMVAELYGLRDKVRDSYAAGRGYEAAVDHGYEARVGDPGRI